MREIVFSPRSSKLRKFKYFKRVLASFVDTCQTQDLDVVYQVFDIGSQFDALLDERFGTLLLNSIVLRGHRKTTSLLLSRLSKQLPFLINARYFKLFIHRLGISEASAVIKKKMLGAMAKAGHHQLGKAAATPSGCYFLAFVVISLLSENDEAFLRQIQVQIEHPDHLKKTLCSLASSLYSPN